MRVLDLFSGIGGFSLGLERAGMRTVAFCEIDPYCRAVLAKHWPGVPIFGNICDLTATDVAGVDLICGGFPCQDISVAGKGAGLAGARSGLWREYLRLIGELRPRYVLVENVAALLGRGLGTVLGDLAEIGYDAEWHCIPASHLGAPHRRDRIWIVAYPERPALHERPESSVIGRRAIQTEQAGLGCGDVADANDRRKLQPQGSERHERGWPSDCGWWSVEPNVGRVAHGVPARVHRLRALGNSIVPQIAEMIGRAIMRHEHGR